MTRATNRNNYSEYQLGLASKSKYQVRAGNSETRTHTHAYTQRTPHCEIYTWLVSGTSSRRVGEINSAICSAVDAVRSAFGGLKAGMTRLARIFR